MDEVYYELTVNPSSHRELFADFLADTLPVGFEETDEGFIVRSEEDLETMKWRCKRHWGRPSTWR